MCVNEEGGQHRETGSQPGANREEREEGLTYLHLKGPLQVFHE